MFIVEQFYKKVLKKTPPYYSKYSLITILWKPVIKFINVVIIPNIPFNNLRIYLYRLIGFKIGKNVFIGMKCYMDDMDPPKTIIEDHVRIYYGVYFSCHGKNQGHEKILICEHCYIGMRCNILSGKEGITLGRCAVIGAGSLVNKSVDANSVAVGVPAKTIRKIKQI